MTAPDTSPMDADPIALATARLLDARRSGTPQPPPALPDAAAAYAVQDRVAAALGWFAPRAPARHWKSGGASRAAVPTHAPLPPAGVWCGAGDARGWPIVQWRVVEAEVALRLGRDVGPADAAAIDGVDAARAFVDSICVSIELCDSRWIGGIDAPPLAKLADLQSHAALVLGAWRPFDAAMAGRDWAAQRCEVVIGEQPPRAFTGTHSMGDPAWVLPAWLRHATRDGATLPAGSVVTTGTWCGMLPAAAGDRVDVRFDGIGSAQLQL